MKFIIGEGIETWLQQASYDGTIGLFYKDTGGGVLAYVTFGLICILALVGLFTIFKWLFVDLPRKKKSKKW